MEFIGQFEHTIDTKSRIVIPTEFKDILGDIFYLVRRIEKCLTIYSAEKWEEVMEKLSNLPLSDPYARSLMRFFGSGVKECTLDPQNLIMIPQPLKAHAMLEKKCTFIGVFNKIELWSSELWAQICNNDYQGEPAVSEQFSMQVKELGI